MNLHQIVASAVGAVNPFMTVTIRASTGYGIDPAGNQVPSYAPPVAVRAQRQPLQYNDIVQLDGLNIQGTRCKLYLDGDWLGLVRADQKGGDLITLPDGSVWLVVLVAENWSDQDGWTSIICTLQDEA